MELRKMDCSLDGFEKAIDSNFRCRICLKELEEPMQCRNNEHYFCASCINKSLANSETCPLCREELTHETLQPAPRIITNVLSQLRYHYENKAKGCCDGESSSSRNSVLKNHASNCGFHPVVCSNPGCFMIISKRDRELHETFLCGSNKMAKCDDCGKGLRFKRCGCKFENEIKTLKGELHRVKTDSAAVKKTLMETRNELEQVKIKNYQLVCGQEKMGKEIREIKIKLENYQAMSNMKQTSVQVPYFNVKDDIIIAGGWKGWNMNSAETFSWSTRQWLTLPAMKERRFGAASVVYDGQMLVVGGLSECDGSYAETLEAIEITRQPQEWLCLVAKLPVYCYGHNCVLHGNHLFVIGGYTATSVEYTDCINDVLLVPPHTSETTCRMPVPRCYAGVELINEHEFVILGGQTTIDSENDGDCVDTVLLYNIEENKFTEKASLPFPVSCMATVRLQDDVILIGGSDENGDALDTAVMYDTKTGRSQILPPMKHKRTGCTAVITGNIIVVMGGYNKRESYLNSVECFSFVRETWEELPSMNEPRYRATAVTKRSANRTF